MDLEHADPEAHAIASEALDMVHAAIDASTLLDARARDVLRMRFGLHPYEHEHLLKDIASKHGLHSERVRQIEQNSMAKLAHNKRIRVAADQLGVRPLHSKAPLPDRRSWWAKREDWERAQLHSDIPTAPAPPPAPRNRLTWPAPTQRDIDEFRATYRDKLRRSALWGAG